MKYTTSIITAFMIVLLLLASPQPARAYADPGSGALLYQVVYAAFLAGTFYLRRVLDRVFNRRK